MKKKKNSPDTLIEGIRYIFVGAEKRQTFENLQIGVEQEIFDLENVSICVMGEHINSIAIPMNRGYYLCQKSVFQEVDRFKRLGLSYYGKKTFANLTTICDCSEAQLFKLDMTRYDNVAVLNKEYHCYDAERNQTVDISNWLKLHKDECKINATYLEEYDTPICKQRCATDIEEFKNTKVKCSLMRQDQKVPLVFIPGKFDDMT